MRRRLIERFLRPGRFNDPAVRDKVTRVVLLWVNNHFTDFETDPSMMDFLETFESMLEASKMHSHVSRLAFHPAPLHHPFVAHVRAFMGRLRKSFFYHVSTF